jgi:uncharacterized repeat protein (TIGR01451 family)
VLGVLLAGCDGGGAEVSDEAQAIFSGGTVSDPGATAGMVVDKFLSGAIDADASEDISIGDTLEYTVEVRNTGTVPLTNVRVTDPLASINQTVASLNPGANVFFTGTYVVTTDDAEAGQIVNTASADSDQTDPVQASLTLSVSSPPPPEAAAASLKVLVSSPQLATDGEDEIVVTAIVEDKNNVLLADVPVTFAASSGALQVTRAVTDESGTAQAIFTTGADRANQLVTLTATVLTLSDSEQVDVTGTTLDLSGPSAIAFNSTVGVDVDLTDSKRRGIADQPVDLSSAGGITLSAISLTTDASGTTSANVTGNTPGPAMVTATAPAVNASDTLAIQVSDLTFLFSGPASGTAIALNTGQPVIVHLERLGAPLGGVAIDFASTRGRFVEATDLTPNTHTVITDAAGNATVAVIAADVGPATVTATANVGDRPSAELPISFYATEPNRLILRADPTTVIVGQASTITATVIDINGNLVKGANVSFTLATGSFGELDPPAVVTDGLGTASTRYIPQDASIGFDNTVIGLLFNATPTLVDRQTVAIGVAKAELFVEIGTGNEIFESEDDTHYRLPYTALVTDAMGNPVANQPVELAVELLGYRKGCYVDIDDRPDQQKWVAIDTTFCPSEDLNRNGILDRGEDGDACPLVGDPSYNPNCVQNVFGNLSGFLEPGGGVAVPPTVTTDATGFAPFTVEYPQDRCSWVQVRLIATATVGGSEGRAEARFVLPCSAGDLTSLSPPGGVCSLYGIATDCTVLDF